MSRISNTIELAGASWRVLKSDKELLLLPVMSLLATLAVAATFLVPVLSGCDLEAECTLGTPDYVLLGAMYLALAFITIFFNAALVHAAHERMSGGDPTLGSALRGAVGRVHRILPWAIVSATVSLILRAIEERAGMLGKVVSALAGVAWSLVTFLVIPVLVVEGVGVGEAVRRSGAMFKRTWGENVAAQVGFGLLGFLAALPAAAAIAIGVAAGGAILVILMLVGIGWILLVSLVMATLNGIFQTALYRYAVGQDPTGFGAGAMAQAFTAK